MLTVKQLARLAGVTPRTLRHYDQIGLLPPTRVGENGYRYYGEDAVLRLQQILLYRELDLPLEQIRELLDHPGFDARRALESHRDELRRRVGRLQRLIDTVEQTIRYMKGEITMSQKQLFEPLSEEQRAAYEQEAMQEYDPVVVKESNRRYNALSAEEKQRIGDEGNAVYAAFVAAIPLGPDSDEARACVERWRAHIGFFWTPNEAQLLGLAQMYNQDSRFKVNFDKVHPELAAFVLQAVEAYLRKQ
ncbi:MAG: MerR family transcriptional regulator [Anaerolineae bacterium]|nr:MerR family transcriptional regulator [Anaerolineae bacterium]